MTDRSVSALDEFPEAYLDRAIAAVLSIPLPQVALERAVAAAASWQAATLVPAPRPVVRWNVALATSGIAVSALIVGILMLNFPPSDRKEQAKSDAGAKGQPTAQPIAKFFERGPMVSAETADAAPIVACTGPEKPAKLGTVVPHAEVNKGLDPSVVRLHIWDWSKSDVSRVILVQRSELGVLSPDGTMMLTKEGEIIDLQTRKTRQYSGFQVATGQRVASVRLSPTGKYAAMMIDGWTETEVGSQDAPRPRTAHRWLLRVLDLQSGKRIGQFPAQASAGVAFSPGENWFTYSSEKHAIVRRDLPQGEVLNEYQPRVGTHGAVGIAVSPDGRSVAAGQYHGKLCIWEVPSGKLAVENQFLRDDGEPDTFFQAKVLRFSPDGKLLAMASGSRLKVVESKTGKVVKEHYRPETPAFVQLQWSRDARRIALVTYAEPTNYAEKSAFPPRPMADRLPRVYEWDWQTGEPQLKSFP